MLLAIDIGNTNIVIGLFDQDKLIYEWRISTDITRSSDEYGMLIKNLLSSKTLLEKSTDSAIIASVVPSLTLVIKEVMIRYLDLRPIIVSSAMKTDLTIQCINPEEVGADRIVNAVAAYALYKGPVIVVDLGTATTFDVISSDGEYQGGVIAPGLMISADALFSKAAKLFKVELIQPDKVIGRDTIGAMRSGIVLGHASMVEGMISRIISESGDKPYVVATGGLSSLIAPVCRMIKTVNPHLTLEGLRILYEKNRLLQTQI